MALRASPAIPFATRRVPPADPLAPLTIALPDGDEPQAVAYDEDLQLVVVLAGAGGRSRVHLIDGGFLTLRATVDFPEVATDLTLSGGYLFAPGANGIYIVDLSTQTLVSRPWVDFDQTGEIAVSDDQHEALVQFHSAWTNAGPGIALVDLTTGRVREIWR